MSNLSDPLVSTAWLAEHLDAPDVRVVDASWHMPAASAIRARTIPRGHIPGAVFFDIDEISDETSDLPHMIPTAVKFASKVKKLGLGDGSRIVVYDSSGILPAARAWWHFRAMGHEDVVVLDGGLPKWIAEGRPVEDGPAAAGAPLHAALSRPTSPLDRADARNRRDRSRTDHRRPRRRPLRGP
jgi:thiosulfate/3-mercaptopyruvate sulfurtransferase